MTTHRAIACALALSIAATTSVWGAEKKKTAKKPVGRTETLACRLGTEDRHARIAVVVIKGKTDSFAYYSKWKPRTCSIYLERNRDPYSKWADAGNVTTVSLEKGAFLIEHKPGEYHFIFRNIDRERYCGMDGVINGTLTIKRGDDQCVLGGEIMAEGTPLGYVPAAYANAETSTPTATAEAAVPQAASVTEQAAAAKPAEKETAAVEPAPEKARTAEAKPPAEGGVATEPAETKTAEAETKAAEAETKTAQAEPAKEQGATVEWPKIEAAQPGPAAPTTTAAAEPEKEESSINPFRAFFRALAPRPAEERSPFP